MSYIIKYRNNNNNAGNNKQVKTCSRGVRVFNYSREIEIFLTNSFHDKMLTILSDVSGTARDFGRVKIVGSHLRIKMLCSLR